MIIHVVAPPPDELQHHAVILWVEHLNRWSDGPLLYCYREARGFQRCVECAVPLDDGEVGAVSDRRWTCLQCVYEAAVATASNLVQEPPRGALVA